MYKIQTYGYLPDLADFRDLPYVPKPGLKIPSKVSNFNPSNPILDQGQLGSCTAHGSARAFRQAVLKQGLPDFAPARRQIYYDERKIEGTINQDSGAQIRDALKVLVNTGVADEKLCPYDISKFKVKPTKAAYASAAKNKSTVYYRIDNTKIDMIRAALTEKFIIIIGFTVYTEFESAQVAKSGILPMPAKSSKPLGGHCVVVEDFDDSEKMATLTNSWGASWGLKGRFKMPYEYLTNTNLVSDCWIVEVVS